MKPTDERQLWPDERSSEDWRLRLALLKESMRYRDFWAHYGGDKVLKAHEEIEAFYDTLPNIDQRGLSLDEHEKYLEACGEALAALGAFDSGLWSFGLKALSSTYRSTEALKELDPANEDVPKRLSLGFRDLPAMALLETTDGPPMEGRLKIPIDVAVKRLKPYERLLRIDLSRKRGELLEEFKRLLDSVEYWRQTEDKPAAMIENYSKWEPDNSRFRAESWQALAIWRLRRRRQSFSEIARHLEMKESAVKMAFRRAFELIEGHPYDPAEHRRDISAVRLTDIRRTCDTCEIRKTCTELCPDALQYADQDRVAQRALMIGEPEY